MANVDQRRINNQRSEFVGAGEAARVLGVKRATLYAYVSRGLLRSLPGTRGRPRRYALEDVRRLKAGRDARKGHAAVAAGALDFGQPVLDSALTRIDATGPHYRGRSAVELARRGVTFEAASEWLWTGQAGPATGAVQEAVPVPSFERAARRLVQLAGGRERARALWALRAFCSLCALDDREAVGTRGEVELVRARALLRALASVIGVSVGRERVLPRAEERCAEIAARALGVPRKAAGMLDAMLVLALDHELNVSTFAVRVTASAGADLYACVTAGMCALSGPWHGGMCDRLERLARIAGSAQGARALVRERVLLGEYVPGFGHALYPGGDPRGRLLLERARKLGGRASRLRVIDAIARAMATHGHADATIDLGLCAASAALGLPEGAAGALFALARTAGWVAHMLEQRERRTLLRPRARYVGPA